MRGRRRIDSVCPTLTARRLALDFSLSSPHRAPLYGACLCAAPLGVGWCRPFGVGVAMILPGPRLSGFDSALCVRSRRKRGVGPGNGYALPGHYKQRGQIENGGRNLTTSPKGRSNGGPSHISCTGIIGSPRSSQGPIPTVSYTHLTLPTILLV